jgi:hypothetical protein
MKRLSAGFVSTAALYSVLAGQVRGGDLEITGFSVERQSDGKVFVHGALKNKSSVKPLAGIEYAFTQFDGKTWAPVKGVAKSSDPIKSIGPGDNVGVWAYLANVGDGEQTFALTARVIANNKVVDIADDKTFTLKARAKEPAKTKIPTVTFISYKCLLDIGGTLQLRVYLEGEEGELTDYRGFQIKRGDEMKLRKESLPMKRPRIAGPQAVVVEFWRSNFPNPLKTDDKLSAFRIAPATSGEQTHTFFGKVDGEFFKYELKYRVDH